MPGLSLSDLLTFNEYSPAICLSFIIVSITPPLIPNTSVLILDEAVKSF
ncbi:MAG: hypothetical protein ACJA1N_001093 [Saprospiraceae bacterium]|jgi:hypothetical protein